MGRSLLQSYSRRMRTGESNPLLDEIKLLLLLLQEAFVTWSFWKDKLLRVCQWSREKQGEGKLILGH